MMKYFLILFTGLNLLAATPFTPPGTVSVLYNKTNFTVTPNGLSQLFSNVYVTNFNGRVTPVGSLTDRELATRFADVVNVLDWNLVGDGISSDYSALTNMLVSVGPNHTFYFPAGNYIFDSPVLITNEVINLKGDGALVTKFTYAGSATTNAFTLQGAIYPDFGYYKNIDGISFDGDGLADHVLVLNHISHCTYNDVTIGGGVISYLNIKGGVLLGFSNLRISHNIGISSGPVPLHNLYIDAAPGSLFSNSIYFDGIIAEGASDFSGVLTNGTGQVVINGGTFEASGKGIRITHNSNANTIIGNDMEGNTGVDIQIDDNSVANVLINNLGETGVLSDTASTVFIGGRFGYLTIGTNAVGNTLLGTTYNVTAPYTNIFIDAGTKTTYKNVLNLFTAEVLTKDIIETPETLVKSPFRILDTAFDTNYALFFGARVVTGGAVNYDFYRYNSGGVGFKTNMTLGYWGNVGIGFPNIIDTSAKLAINGGLNVGGTNDPGTGIITADNIIRRLSATNTMAMWNSDSTGPYLVSSSVRESDILTPTTATNYYQAKFTTGVGVTNIANVLSGVISAGTNVVLTTNGNAIVVNASATVGGTGYVTIQDEGVSATQRTIANFIGGGVSAVDNPGSSRTDITVTRSGIVRELWIPATLMVTNTSTYALTNSYYLYGNPAFWQLDSMVYGPDAIEGATFTLSLPSAWNKSSFKIKLYWTATSGTATQNVVWTIDSYDMHDGSSVLALAPLSSANVSIIDSYQGADKVHITSAGTITFTGTGVPLDDDVQFFRIIRDGASVSDTMTGGAILLGAKIQYTESSTEPTAW